GGDDDGVVPQGRDEVDVGEEAGLGPLDQPLPVRCGVVEAQAVGLGADPAAEGAADGPDLGRDLHVGGAGAAERAGPAEATASEPPASESPAAEPAALEPAAS